MIPKNLISKKSPIYIAVFLFPSLVATVSFGGSTIYLLLLLFGLFFGWPSWKLLESWERKVLFGFLILFVLINLSLLNTQDFYGAIKKEARYVLFPLLIPMYLLIKRYQVETGKVYLYGFMLSSLVLFAFGLYQNYILHQLHPTWTNRVPGAYNPIILGNVAILIFAITSCALFTVAKNWRHYLLGFVTMVLAIIVVLMSGTRGAWILLPVLLLWFFWIYKNSLKPIHLMSIVMIFLLSIFGSYYFIKVKYRVDLAISELRLYMQDNTKLSATQTRAELWRDSIGIWKEHSLIGTGIGDFRSDQKKLIDDGVSNVKRAFGDAHNIYFDALATTGLVGLLALLVFVFLIPFLMFHSFWKKEKDPWIQFYSLSGMTTIIAFAVFGLTSVWLARNPLLRTYLMTILVFMSSIAVIKQTKTSNKD